MLSYCAGEVRRHDRDRYLACLFAPAERREALFALYAFNLEVAKTAELVSEAMLGRIRLQWWREALDGIYAGAPRRHAVVEPLAEAVRRYGLDRRPFDRLIDGRESDLDAEPPVDLAALENYAEATSASLVGLALDILGAQGEPGRTAGRHLGVAWALVGLLRAIPFHARAQRCYLPRDLLEAAGLDPKGLHELRGSRALARVVETVAGCANGRLTEARAPRREVASAALPALLPAVLASHYLDRLATAGFDPFHTSVQAEAPGKVWRLAWARLRGRY